VRTLFVLCLGLTTAFSTVAQERTESSGKFYGALASGSWPKEIIPLSSDPRNVVVVSASQAAMRRETLPPQPSCSIPLLEAQVPQDVHFAIKDIHPRTDAVSPMPRAKGPAPSCASSATR
jgi:hypothetical protein